MTDWRDNTTYGRLRIPLCRGWRLRASFMLRRPIGSCAVSAARLVGAASSRSARFASRRARGPHDKRNAARAWALAAFRFVTLLCVVR